MFELFTSELSASTAQYIEHFASNAPKYISALVIFLFFWLLSSIQRYTAGIITQKIESNSAKTMSVLFGRLTRFLILSVGTIISFSILGVDWGALVTGLGLVGFGVSFALKDYIENFLAGVIILTQKPFKIGDQVKVKETHGVVKEIATRYTIIKDFDGKQVILPNSEMLSSSITLDNAYGRKRYSIEISIDPKTDIVFALQEGLDLVRKTVGVLTKPKPRSVVAEITDGRVVIRYYFWAHPREVFELSIRSHLHKNILHLFKENGIELGYQTSRVYSGSIDTISKKYNDDDDDDRAESSASQVTHHDDGTIFE